MKLDTIEKLCCPFDKADLNLTSLLHRAADGAVERGYLTCKHCKRIYPIISGIPIMNPDEYREFDMEKSVLEEAGVGTTFRIDRT